jgi:hypothetical protein
VNLVHRPPDIDHCQSLSRLNMVQDIFGPTISIHPLQDCHGSVVPNCFIYKSLVFSAFCQTNLLLPLHPFETINRKNYSTKALFSTSVIFLNFFNFAKKIVVKPKKIQNGAQIQHGGLFCQ